MMTYFDEQPDAPVHGECVAEIEKLNNQVLNLAFLLQRAIAQIAIYDTGKKSILPIKAAQYLKQENLLRSPIDRAYKCFKMEVGSTVPTITHNEQARWNALEDAYRAADAVLPIKDGVPRNPAHVRIDILDAINALQCAKPAEATGGWIEWSGTKINGCIELKMMYRFVSDLSTS
jgi:hypothetical protein